MERDDVVCTCLGTTYGDLEDAIANGADSFEAVQEATQVGTACGLCIESVQEMVEELLKK